MVTWEKTPSMGWMFVPRTEYHGGGEQATIEPLSLLGILPNNALVKPMVQAVYRGHRLFDSDHVREGVIRPVKWSKSNRDIRKATSIPIASSDGLTAPILIGIFMPIPN